MSWNIKTPGDYINGPLTVAGSATITGDLTVDTSTLKVDSANDRVGIQSTLLNSRLTVRAGTIAGIDIYRDDSNANFSGIRFKGTTNSTVNAQIGWNGTQIRIDGTDEVLLVTNSSDRFRITTGGVFTWENVGGVAGTAMTLNSTGLGIGVASPATKLDVRGAVNASQATFSGTASRGLLISTRSDGLADDRTVILNAQHSTGAQGQLVLQTVGTDRLLIDSSGNVGVGVTPTTSRLLLKGNGTNIPVKIVGTTGDTTIPHLVIDKKDNNTTTSQLFIQFVINDNNDGSGQINANGANQAAFGTYSDSRLKKNIVNLPSQLANILSLRPVEFDYKDGNGHQIGFIAQEMQEVYADAVGEQEGFLTVSGWNKTEARLVSAIKELAAKVQALEAKLA
jgi:hypothetical protein